MGEVELKGISVAFGDAVAVEDATLRVRDGELLVLVGPSGCGKTTLLRTIAGLERPTRGEVYVGGRRVTDLPARRRDVSLVFQGFALFPHLTARENLAFDLRMQGYDEVDRRVATMANRLEIADLVDRSIYELSGGQKQRVALGRAAVTEPTAFLLDEPLSNLDANLRERMRTEITRLQEDLAVTTVHVTHDQSEALSMGDRIAVMRNGRIEQVGTPETVYRRPASLFVARFVGSPRINFVRGRYDRDAGVVEVTADNCANGDDRADDSRTAGEGLTVPVTLPDDVDEVVLGVRPEHVAVADERRGEDPNGRSDGDWIDAVVGDAEFHGADRFVYLDVPWHSEFVARVPGETDVGAGAETSVRFPLERSHCFDAESGRRFGSANPTAPAPAEPSVHEAAEPAGHEAADAPEGDRG